MSPDPGAIRIRVAAIIEREGHLLLVRHEKDRASYWLLPGGGVEYGESLEAALVRETREETGYDIAVDRLVLVSDSIPPDRHRHTVQVCFTASIVGGAPRCGADGRLVEVAFVPVADLPGLVLLPDLRAPLVEGLRDGFRATSVYQGSVWRD